MQDMLGLLAQKRGMEVGMKLVARIPVVNNQNADFLLGRALINPTSLKHTKPKFSVANSYQFPEEVQSTKHQLQMKSNFLTGY